MKNEFDQDDMHSDHMDYMSDLDREFLNWMDSMMENPVMDDVPFVEYLEPEDWELDLLEPDDEFMAISDANAELFLLDMENEDGIQ